MAKTETTQARPTAAALWRKARVEGELIRLPGSGNVARLRKPSLTALAATTNGIPNPLSYEVMRLLASPPTDNEQERIAGMRQNSRGYIEVAALCLIEPKLKLVGEPGEGEISPEDLSDFDLWWIYNVWVEGMIENVAPFRIAEGTPGS